MTGWILAVLALYFVQTFLPAITRYAQRQNWNAAYLLGARDDPAPATRAGQRLDRALRNMQEALFVFLPVALLLQMQGVAGGMAGTGAAVFFWARAAYVPAYASAIPALRSVIWTVGHAGLAMMVWVMVWVLVQGPV